jgi:hypothetical protein
MQSAFLKQLDFKLYFLILRHSKLYYLPQFKKMKKLLILTNLFWFSIVIIFACRRPVQVNTPDCKTFCYNYSTVPFPGLSKSVAENMAGNYRKLPTSPGLTIETDTSETRSVWFKLETIKNFIYQIETSTCQLKCDKIKAEDLGIRFYFAKYPQASDAVAADEGFAFLRNKPRFYGKKTLFMVPTYYTPDNGDIDFDPRWTFNNAKECAPTQLSRIKGSSGYKMVAATPEADGMQNHGNLCPPDHCPGMAF